LLVQGKLRCKCDEDLFFGIPCRHQTTIFFKFNLQFEALPFDSRWRLDYYNDQSQGMILINALEKELIYLREKHSVSKELNKSQISESHTPKLPPSNSHFTESENSLQATILLKMIKDGKKCLLFKNI